jgi:hypothetical protein
MKNIKSRTGTCLTTAYTLKDEGELQQQKLPKYSKITEAIAVSNISLISNFAKEDYWEYMNLFATADPI